LTCFSRLTLPKKEVNNETIRIPLHNGDNFLGLQKVTSDMEELNVRKMSFGSTIRFLMLDPMQTRKELNNIKFFNFVA